MTDRTPPTESEQPTTDPRTNAGHALLNDVREVVIHGVYDRIPGGGYELAWHVQRGITAIEAEARRDAIAEVRRRVERLSKWNLGMRNRVRGDASRGRDRVTAVEAAAVLDVLDAVDEGRTEP